MTTIKEFREWLKRFPDDTTIEIVYERSYYDIELLYSDIGDGWEFIDFTKNERVKQDHPYYGKKVLFLGEES